MIISGSMHEREWVHFIVIIPVTYVHEKQKRTRNDSVPIKSNRKSLLVVCIKKMLFVDRRQKVDPLTLMLKIPEVNFKRVYFLKF